LLAWLGQQLRQAEQGGRLEAVARLQRRIAIAEGPSAILPKALP
jgi:hypothetical protein